MNTPQVIAQIPPPPMNVPMPVRKALMIDGENKVVRLFTLWGI